MPKKTFTPEQIVGKLGQIEVLVGQGKTVPLLGTLFAGLSSIFKTRATLQLESLELRH